MSTMLRWEDMPAAAQGRWTARPPAPGPVPGVSIDSRTLQAGQLFVAIAGPRFDGHDFVQAAFAQGAAAAVVHRDVGAPPSAALLRVGDTTRALASLARHVRALSQAPVVCITGSTGKTTTKEMTAALLATRGAVLKTEGNLNNHYGLPLSLLRLSAEHSAAVLELGMSGAGELRALTHIARPDVAVITNVAPVHLEFFKSVDAIAAAKAEILEGLSEQGLAVLNRDDARLRSMGATCGRSVAWFGRGPDAQVRAARERVESDGMRFDLTIDGRSIDVCLPFLAPHAVVNFLAAAAVADSLGVDLEAMPAVARQLKAAPQRGQARRLKGEILVIDDSYNSNPAAVVSAGAALTSAARGRRVAFLADMLELGPDAPRWHHEAGTELALHVDVLVAVGPLSAHFLEGARSAGLARERLIHCPDSVVAAREAVAIVQAGDTVLVKGSRGMRTERIVEALVAHFGVREGEL